VELDAGEIGGSIKESEIDPFWPFLEGIYEILFSIVTHEAFDTKTLKYYITEQFVQEFMDLFDTENPSERDYLKNILHKLYAQLVPRRKMIRRMMNSYFYSLIHEGHSKANGTAEILDIQASIISGYAVPLRPEHATFFETIIIPLHKLQTSPKFYEQLLRCSMLFTTKDRSLATTLLEALLKYWPFANTVKEILFLTEL